MDKGQLISRYPDVLQDFKMFHQIFEFVGDYGLVLCGELFKIFWSWSRSLTSSGCLLLPSCLILVPPADFSMTDRGFFFFLKPGGYSFCINFKQVLWLSRGISLVVYCFLVFFFQNCVGGKKLMGWFIGMHWDIPLFVVSITSFN